jgi:hypothetical protein
MPWIDPSRKHSAIYTRKSSDEGLEGVFARTDASLRRAPRRATHRDSRA